MRSFNLFDGELDESRDQPGFSWRRASVGEVDPRRLLEAGEDETPRKTPPPESETKEPGP